MIPRYLIAQKCLWGGWRPAPIVREVFIKPKPVNQMPSGYTPAWARVDTSKYSIPDIEGFIHWEYRFWACDITAKDGQPVCECRCCSSVFVTAKDRAAHGKDGCNKKLVAAYKLLLRDRICPICNMKSYKEKWGIPLCSPSCTEAWCHVEPHPDALMAAIQLVGDIK